MIMRRYIIYIVTIFLIAFLIFELIVIGIIKSSDNVFYSSYQSVIVDKYRRLQNTDSPKIIIISGSSSAFGINQDMLENSTGYSVVNLGLHAGFGALFNTELAKENIKEGDIVLLGYEYNWPDDFDDMGQDLIMSGIDENLDIYKHIPFDFWPDFIGYIFTYAEKKHSYEGASGVYSRESFDSKNAQMIIDREYSIDYEANIDYFGQVDLSDVTIEDNTIEYLVGFKEFVEKRGARVYFIAPPLLKEAINCDYSEFNRLKEKEEQLIGIRYISSPQDYFFEKELMFDTIYHCSTKGEITRTQLLINDLKKANAIR